MFMRILHNRNRTRKRSYTCCDTTLQKLLKRNNGFPLHPDKTMNMHHVPVYIFASSIAKSFKMKTNTKE